MGVFRFFVPFVFLLSIQVSAYNIDKNQISVSGLSSGAYMAGQVHVAFSNIFMGAGLIAGGPYYCAKNSSYTAQIECMGAPSGTTPLQDLISEAKRLEKIKLIAPLSSLASSRVYIFNGQNDSVVVKSVADEAVNFYRKLGVPASRILYVSDIPAGHGFPTVDYGNDCAEARKAPFLSKCNYDAAGMILNHIYGDLKAPLLVARNQNVFKFSQKKYLSVAPSEVSLADNAYVYIPKSCVVGEKCRLHFAFHGCKQTTKDIGAVFYTKAGYNEWAEANNIIVVYPQAVRTFGNNPNGCWDWWGYTSDQYHTQQAPQMQMIFKMVQDFTQAEMRIKSL